MKVFDKFTGESIGEVPEADAAAVDAALTHLAAYAPPPAHERKATLLRVRDAVEAQRERFRETITAEAGFPVRDAEGEVARALQTLALSAEEAGRLTGETVPLEGAPGGAGRIGFTLRVPVGIVAAITPFNAPLNTVCHKVGPAYAAGNGVALKPSEKTPLTAELLRACFDEAGAGEAIRLLHGSAEVAGMLLDDLRPGFFAFTGSTRAGAEIQARAGLRRTQMELGSISATIVLADADVEAAAAKCVASSFRKAGQVCTSIQMLMVDHAIYDGFRDRFLDATSRLVWGDPHDPATDVGPMISSEAADRVTAMLRDQTVALGGHREGPVISPTVIEMPEGRVLEEEIFGPVVCLVAVRSLEEAIGRVNATPYGLATGLFTNDLGAAMDAARRLRVGGVHVNETSSSRVDLMPYGGVKASGFGHEGPARAVREMSEERLVTIST